MTRHIKRISLILVLLFVSMGALLFFMPIPPLLSGVVFSQAIYDANNQLLRMTLSQDGKFRLFTPLSAISPALVNATLLEEDQYFRWHPGVNPLSLIKAGWRSYVSGPRRMGASTITMQVARIRYGIQSKTPSGKLSQILRAIQLEMHYSKDQILEAYLNLAPYGNNIEGVGAASLVYFDKPAAGLALPESLTLAVIPQNPVKRVQDRGVLRTVRNKLYERWLTIYPEDADRKGWMALPLQMRRLHSTPFLAPHFVNEVLADAPAGSHHIKTTLDLRLQRVIERVTRNYISRKQSLGVTNAAVMLVDTRDMSTKALLGSANFFNSAIGGQINGTSIKRSPGSTLKPFIYALAMDQGLIHPATVLKDVPHSFGSYNPENFDYDFVGPIKAKDALILSRNIPAVYLAEQLKQPTLYQFLEQSGIHGLKSESYYGLALVLGGAEMTMQELISLYAALANRGIWKPVRMRIDSVYHNSVANKRILSPEASFLVLDILKDAQGSGGNNKTLQGNKIPVAWKTGTSSGYRDAWTFGIFGPYVLGVWIGNFNNEGNPAFIGKEMAAPLFFDIANAVSTQTGLASTDWEQPKNLRLVKADVCKSSGMLPTRYCSQTEKVWFIPGQSPIKADNIHREIAIDGKTGLRTCRFDSNTRFEIYEFWPSDLLRIFRRAGMHRRLPPPYNPECDMSAKTGAGISPQIISPQSQVNYVARIAAIRKTVVPLTAVVDADVRNLYWFLNDSFLGRVTREKSYLWHAQPGKYVVRVVDDYGRSDARDVLIRLES
ncbi:Penicillin-binding protein 1F [Aquicella siphonis]|uniref:peptidoglycan glycosyltransferase n=1 Tax=Aquicella siphonis TaxID=254247 RepID=A0A5E4PLJ2_9COXI|nr:penicillin-binding protein 1C [Aquicella siphonis]VVC77247.1 Penicillin-binding protein 1F [Aquicella siphonis]